MKHQHAIRFVYDNRSPLMALGIYESSDKILTIDDFKAINDRDDSYQMIMSFYIGFMSNEDAHDKLEKMNIKIARW